jgi:hypothetical protein
MGSSPRSHRQYQDLRHRLMATLPPVCWLCGKPIDLQRRWPDRWSWTLDHVQPLKTGGALLDSRNARPAHLACNSKRGASPPSRRVTSERW